MYLQAGSLFPNHWNRGCCRGLFVQGCPGAEGTPSKAQPEAQRALPSSHPHSPGKGQSASRANKTTKFVSLRPPFVPGLHVMVPATHRNLFRNKTKWVQNQIFKVSTSKENKWLKLGLIIDPSMCRSKVRPKLNNYFSEIIFD